MPRQPIARSPAECPRLEIIAAFVDGMLSDRERARISAHVAACERCYFLFAETARVRPHRPPRARTHTLISRAALLLTSAATLLFLVPAARPAPARSDPALAALVDALGATRIVEPRLSAGFDYAPMRIVRTAEASHEALPPDVRIAVAQIEKRAAERRVETLAPLGVAYLVTGQPARAVQVLESAIGRGVASPPVLSDLAAAYLVRAASGHQSQDFVRALAAADRAVTADTTLAAAWFNRALALERLSLTDEALAAWHDYVRVDPASAWATEARIHAAALTTSSRSREESHARERQRVADAARHGPDAAILDLVRQSPHAVREWIDDQLLVAWPRLVDDGRLRDADDLVAQVTPVASMVATERGDGFLRDAAAAAAAASGDPPRMRALAAAHRGYQAAFADYQDDRIRQSAAGFEVVLPALERAHSPLALAARFYLAVASYYASDLDVARAALGVVGRRARPSSYTRLLGFVHRIRGLIHVTQGRYGEGLDDYRAALACFERVGDVENDAGIHASLAESLDFVGEREAAWAARYAALSRLSLVHDRRRRHTILQGAAIAAARQELPEAALYFQRAALENARRWGRPSAAVNILMHRAEVYDKMRQADNAEADLREAERTLSRIDDAGLVARSRARIQLARGEIDATRQPQQAIRDLDIARAALEGGGANWAAARMHLARARAQLARGRADLAEDDLRAGIAVFERMRASLTSDALRSAYFEQPWDLFAEMIRLQAGQLGRPDRALAFAEQARARTLLEAVSPSPQTPPVDPAQARQSLPAGVTVLYFASLDERLLVWALTRARLAFVDVPMGQDRIAGLIEEYRARAATLDGQDVQPALAALYDALLRPIAPMLDPGTRLAIVPDGVLHAVPFAALLRREDRRYLVQDHLVQITPSMTVFQMVRGGSSRTALRDERALIVGNPRVPWTGVGGDLPGAQAEARDIAAMYRAPALLIGRDATKARFLDAAATHAIVHFAGHAIPNEDYPGLSRLLLSGDGDSGDTLFAHEIGARRFASTRLVVLAACQTNVGRIRRGEGIFSLARPFLSAGVSAVVASLANVDDRTSHRLFVAFHRALRDGQAATEALRSAQLAALADSDADASHPAHWGSVTVVGGVSAIGHALAVVPVASSHAVSEREELP